MEGEYRKFQIKMEYMTDKYRLWKKGRDGCICFMESYKDKRAVYLAVSNFLPSGDLYAEEEKKYCLLLLGANEGEIIYRDFGEFFVGSDGEGSLFKKFTGEGLECFTHCLLVVTAEGRRGAETALKGVTPFYAGKEEESLKGMFEKYMEEGEELAPFSEGEDETGASWRRFSDPEGLPRFLKTYDQASRRYGHFILGKGQERFFIGIPGRFLIGEKPGKGSGCFTLWQPIKGGEKYYGGLSELTGKLQEEIYGYWIGEIDLKGERVLPL